MYDEVFPDDKNVAEPTNRTNSLNRFVAYHLINKELSYTKFISDYDTKHMSKVVDLFEYIEPMCPNTLIEVKIGGKPYSVKINNDENSEIIDFELPAQDIGKEDLMVDLIIKPGLIIKNTNKKSEKNVF